MSAHRQKFLLKAFVDPDQLKFGLGAKSWVLGSVAARHKWNRPGESPYCIPNEMICAELGRFIGLPIPPYALTKSDEVDLLGRDLFSTLDFNWNGRNLSPVDATCCIRSLPVLCAGVVVFDVFIANKDRHPDNLSVDRTDVPKSMRVFDHDAALFGTFDGEGVKRLNEMNSRLGISGSTITGGDRHVFIDAINSNEHFLFWCNRIHGIPHEFISRVCSAAKPFGLTDDEAALAAKFLNERKWELRGMLNRLSHEFKGISRWTLL